MPLFVTVTPGTTVTSSTTLDASTLNLLGTPSVDVTGTVDGGSITLGVQSVPLPSLYAQADQTIVGNGAGSSASPVALTTTDLVLTPTTVNIGPLAVVEAKIGARAVTASKLFALDGTGSTKLVGRSTASSGDVETLTVGSNIITTGSTLSVLRPAVALTTVLVPSGYEVTTNRVAPQEITALTTSITTQTATSKVLVSFNISYALSALGADSSKYAFILTRTVSSVETELAIPTSPKALQVYGIKPVGMSFYDYQQVFDCIQFLDTPGPAGAVTYKLKIYGSTPIPLAATTGFFLNRTSADGNLAYATRATSQVILQEILP
jgi:hypothetical protein